MYTSLDFEVRLPQKGTHEITEHKETLILALGNTHIKQVATMKMKTEITFEWWTNNGEEIKSSHREPLKECAEKTINKMESEGFICGELYESLKTDDDDPEGGVFYRGYWDKTQQEIN